MGRALILLGVFAAAVSVLLYCSEVEFDNPLDKKGTKYLYNYPDFKGDSLMEPEARRRYYDPSFIAAHSCDRTPPWIRVTNGFIDRIYTNQPEVFRRMLGVNAQGQMFGWPDVEIIEWLSGVDFRQPRLTRGGASDPNNVDYPVGGMPPEGTYRVVYSAFRVPECADTMWAREERVLNIIKFEEVTGPPTVQLRGRNPFTIEIGEVYVDPGVIVQDFDRTEIPLTRIEIFNQRAVQINVISPNMALGSAVAINQDMFNRTSVPNNAQETYTITYHVTSPSNNLTAQVTRTVEVRQTNITQLPTPVIVLNTYNHNFGGRMFTHTDTAVVAGSFYVEKGVAQAYYYDRSTPPQRVNIPVNLVVTGNAPNIQTIGQRRVDYQLQASASYGPVTVSRSVFVHEAPGSCEIPLPPILTFTDGSAGAITITAGQPWQWDGTWNVRPAGDATRAWMYLIDFGGLNPVSPVVGTYNLLYVTLSDCGPGAGMGTTPRTVTVR
jgi:hypothetical protein